MRIDLSLPVIAQAINHGIPEELLTEVVSKGREIFALSKAEKSKFKVRSILFR